MRLTIAIAVAAGLAGGLISRYLTPAVVFAQDQPQVTQEVRAQSFTLVDSQDRTVGTFSFEPDQSAATRREALRHRMLQLNPGGRLAPIPESAPLPGIIVLRDAGGVKIWSAGGAVVQPLSLR
jgi:hypothetical protein